MVEELIAELKGDKEYYYSWQASIAVSFQDAYHWHKTKNGKEPTQDDIHEISNTAAKCFLDLLCKDTKDKIYRDEMVIVNANQTEPQNPTIDPERYLEEDEKKEMDEEASPSFAFWKRLRRIKRQRNRKSIAKVITETTIEEFETQLTKYANNGYKIKYVNIDTKAGNSGSGVRYYAVVHRG